MTINTNFKLLGKLNREFLTISAMIEIYCSRHHNDKCKKVNLCEDCESFKSYVKQRLDRCPYGINKPTCRQCPIHCYKAQEKVKSQTIMHYSGPRMMYKHPIMAITHLINDKRKIKALNQEMTSNRKVRNSE
ncbi:MULTISPECIES: nitrous oxide-stimulated promoter family protein [unclassified Photobacterium]|uniref:nitrous oxide-stimulated promoter family protein n=1 Tax=unclassified Photobacterium TaxID=2628852 RepID=UPI001EE12975|nr:MULTISPECIES: nitrous oxide-stimulated promoter family protein [unclassified Photobacterium]MCG3863383.1 nitrous oxide-stimulated promoter family protein [Photobacterium sp. Ph6]MCG3874912.1 nitrous oxide-stimulated promoter family protein [Photobacterium sp. Ph5]